MNLGVLAARNVLRNRFRTALTVLGVAVAIITFLLLRTVMWAWTVATDVAAKDRIVTRNKITFVMPLPLRYVDHVRSVSGVKAVTWATWFGGKDPKHDREFFATMAIESKSFFDVYNEMHVPPDQMQAWQSDRSGAVVGDALANKLGWKIGDRITLESPIYMTPDGNPWTFNIRGIYVATAKSVDRSTLVFHWDYLNQAVTQPFRDQVGWIVCRIADPSRAAEMGVMIDRAFEEQEVQTVSQDERSFNTSFLGMISAVLDGIQIISGVILLVIVLVLGNTISMGVRERTYEYGVLRSIGFLPRHIALFVLGEAAVTGLLGGVVGVALAYPLVEKGVGRWLEENMGAFFPYFRLQPEAVAMALVLSLVLGLVSAAIPAYQASRLRITDALRRVA
jgi:putative ABC transport system permease protein